MKKLLLSLMVLATLASCGKDNKVSSGAAAATTTSPVINPVIANTPAATALISKIDNPTTAFGMGQSTTAGSGQGANCKSTLWGLIDYCTYSSSGTTNGKTWNTLLAEQPNLQLYFVKNGYLKTSGVSVGSIDVATKQAEIKSYLTTATDIQTNGVQFLIVTPNGNYMIDTRYSIKMNPSAIQSYYETEYFYIAK